MVNRMTNDPTSVNEQEMRFAFGANWADYVEKKFSDERVEISRRHLLGFLKLPDLKGRTFLDIGCGSGLHSLAAWRSGADRVISFDYDKSSVITTKRLYELSGRPGNWAIMQGSILDRAFVDSLPKADIVYSWGVLHHTGSMWSAIENAARCLQEKGVFYVALYSKDVYVSPPYEYWLETKRKYNHANHLKKLWMEWCYAWKDSIRSQVMHGRNPIAYMKTYQQSRGMSYWHDVRDWLGGYPMEFAGNKETESFAREQLGLELINMKAGEGNTEYLFRRVGSENYWDQVLAGIKLNALPGPFIHVGGHAWKAELPKSDIGSAEKFMLYENGSPIGWPNAPRSSIAGWGRGRYCVDGGTLIFSTTDNSNPNDAQKSYAFRPNFL